MKLRYDQLVEQLKTTSSPIYFVTGDEILLVDEACTLLREHIKKQGFDERKVWMVEDAHFDDSVFQLQSDNLSLFSSKKCIEFYCLTEKIPEKLGQALLRYVQAPHPDNCVLVRCGKMAQAQQNTTWFKTIVQQGMVVQVWPIEMARLPAWIAARLKKFNLSCDEAGQRLLARRGENNLFALAQVIEKLHMLYGEGKLSVDQISALVQDQARFQLFDLSVPVLSGDKERALHIMSKLREEGVEPALVLWLLSKEIRELIQGGPLYGKPSPALERKKHAIQQARKRYSLKEWQQSLETAFDIDQLIKGAKVGSAWETLERWVCNSLSTFTR
ncbi:MAG: DNA polymerase III subunit delta [Gammaproteobacteria bacterium]|nr:DNA polymerase III subunit delta [Gammaproteobacteria bacterium]